ncbi:hypothetical protein GALMADRAFT_136102 [Galerina marginata CBS 339.88]|uniref:Uncharacterized protein n=1 Tax=Galerina marginata (strain CBS 339.88) TaxID=685588 RepID=A0A067TD27_GALM3|nr:hypothetical protein GALMADRAFT_136102 [Galerina marginata CBS 339.88]
MELVTSSLPSFKFIFCIVVAEILTKTFMNTLILYLISTELLASILFLVELTTFVALGFNFSHVFLSYMMGAIHAMSFLANLDARRNASLMTGVILVDSSGGTAARALHTGDTVSGGPWQVKVNPRLDEKTQTQFTTIQSSDSGAIETVLSNRRGL